MRCINAGCIYTLHIVVLSLGYRTVQIHCFFIQSKSKVYCLTCCPRVSELVQRRVPILCHRVWATRCCDAWLAVTTADVELSLTTKPVHQNSVKVAVTIVASQISINTAIVANVNSGSSEWGDGNVVTHDWSSMLFTLTAARNAASYDSTSCSLLCGCNASSITDATSKL
jgi:hypothetical protein